MSDLRTFDEIGPDDGDAVGGKGLSLGLLARAGLPVPPGFCITSTAYRRCRGKGIANQTELAGLISSAYQRLGAGPVAVRSSATAEDGAITSFAGQQETILGVVGEAAVLNAIDRCWASLDAERSRAYRQHQGVSDEGLAMAVVVQRLVHAEAAGVLFTRNPLDPTGQSMLVEASWGLGEGVVSGKVMPDRFRLDRDSGAVLERHISTKLVQVTAAGTEPVPTERQQLPCLDDARLAELVELGRRVEAYYKGPRDVEWAWADGKFWLLQARPITTGGAAEREQVRREEMAAAAALAAPEGTVWSRINLAESLPEPTPMTWAIVRRFLSGKGGFGLMYRDLGFRPPAALDEVGVYDLIAGRVYCNLGREPQMSAGWVPKSCPLAAFKAAPHLALDPPQPVTDWSRVGALFWLLLPLRLPAAVLRSARQVVALGGLGPAFATRCRQQVLPAFLDEVRRAAADDLASLDEAALRGRLEHWVRRTLYDFARDGLKPTVRAGIARQNLQRWLQRTLGPDRGREAVNELCMGIRPDPEADLAGAVRDLMAGALDRAAFLDRFGHRGEQEMELSRPRWRENPAALDHLPVRTAAGHSAGVPPAERWEAIAGEARLSKLKRTILDQEVQILHTSLTLRETAKHYLLHGFALMRDVLLEIDRRHGLHGGVFYLTPEELPRLASGEDLAGLIAGRRQRRTLCLSLEVPPVLFSDDLEAIGRPAVIPNADVLKGVPLSAGVAEAPALVLEQPTGEFPPGPYILVCPSTDPAWVPLFVQARGLVMETGGVLSHGAIVAREFGLPAVAGLPGIQRQLRTGQRLRVDGVQGTVTVLP